jgi:sugar-specific transcriptional regulator TrmB
MSDFIEDDGDDINIDNIINQLKNKSNSFKQEVRNKVKLEKEDIESYIIDNSSDVVNGCVGMIREIEKEIKIAPDPKLIEATATLINAFSSALDTLSKLELTDKKIKAQKELKEMDINSKSSNKDSEEKPGIMLSRDEILKLMSGKKSETIDV